MAIDPHLAEWLNGEIQRAVSQAVEPLQKKLDEKVEWMDGLFLALLDLMQAMAKERSPELVQVIPIWMAAADHYELACKGLYPDASPEKLEPRKLLYRMLLTTGALRHLDA